MTWLQTLWVAKNFNLLWKWKNCLLDAEKFNFLLAFITQSYFPVAKDVRLNSANYLIMKIHSWKELQNIATNHSADIDYKDFIKIYTECTKELYTWKLIQHYEQVIL